ncbi:MAG: LPS export ABC transporter ATP-binding protein [Candidatus Aminicenantes bacterium RBG_16_63_16]|nr:MAG: LPS export ABC transporter ATP-binding protein [Candidatus Aminicenantes bacterium RBG_16_63_16]
MNLRLRAVSLEKSYRGKKVVDGISVDIERGEIVGLLGPNGAGKTTTFSMIIGLVPQDGGRIYLGEEDITEMPMYRRTQKGLSLLPQEPSAFRRLSVEDNLRAILQTLPGTSSRGDGDVERTLKEFGLERLARSRAYTLSGGERRRLEIARAMLTRPEFVLLDEPFTGIDPLAIQDLQRIIRTLKEKGLGLVITDHSVRETLKITDRAYIIDKGRILMEGRPRELVEDESVKKSYLGEDFTL